MDEDIRNSTSCSELPPGQNALHIAMRTMKERCYLLQKRLKVVEDENIQLSIQCSKSQLKSDYSDVEMNMLNANIAQLTKEKSQLVHHVFMVACENKKLWSRLSVLTKANNQEKLAIEMSQEKSKSDVKVAVAPKNNSFTVPHLIRSQTFTQSSPNPKLKAKIEEGNEELEESLKEISLKLLANFLAEKSELLQQYEQMVQIQMGDEKSLDKGSFGFAYLDDLAGDSIADIKNQTGKLEQLKKDAIQQQMDLKNCLVNLEKINNEREFCSNCKVIKKSNIELSKDNKNLECLDTSEVSLTKWATPANSASYREDDTAELSSISNVGTKLNISEIAHLPNNRNKDNSDATTAFSQIVYSESNRIENICPMCGKRFLKTNMFDNFVEHVENHFIGDEEIDSITDNFEMVKTSVGNNFE